VTDRGTHQEPIAIIGMSCRFPGASNPEALWKLVVDRQEGTTGYPGGRTPELDAFYTRVGMPDGPASIRGGFLPDIDRFDAAFFEISPREAEWLDPQQRLLLETGWEALEDAGVPVGGLDRAGVFVGVWVSEYERHSTEHSPAAEFFNITGGPLYGASSRLAFQFSMRGPDVSVNAACCSSLVAVHLAVRSLRAGECSLALAGGANALVRPEITQALSRAGMLSPDGRCKFGAATADGFVRSDGAGMLVLKRLPDAVRDRDRVLAIIRGTAVTNNGRSSGFLATPSSEGQQRAMLEALTDGAVDPRTVDYVEAHGTGTRAGDPIELTALAAVYGQRRTVPCRTASVKSNIGHTESAAGVAGIIRTVEAMRRKQIPPTLHAQELTSEIDWDAMGIVLEREGRPWPKPNGHPRRAGVNGLGLTGTNAHVVLEEAPPFDSIEVSRKSAYVLPLSAGSEAALRQRSKDSAAVLARLEGTRAMLEDYCFTAAVRRTHLSHRVAVAGATARDLSERLQEWARGDEPPFAASGVAAPARKVAFVFPGQGSQWVGMGRELLRTNEVFRKVIEKLDAAVERESGWSVLRQLQDPAFDHRLSRIDVVQPTLFAVEVALAEVWKSWGVSPDAVIGHSMGEVAAACVAGILSYDDGARVICRRSALLTRVVGAGAMAVVELTRAEAEQAIAGVGDKVSIAVCNSPRSTVLAGDPEKLNAVVEALEARDTFCRWVHVDVASHSPQMDVLKEDLGRALAEVRPKDGTVPLCSAVRAGLIDGEIMNGSYWVENLREPVLFAAGIEELLRRGFDTFVEMSPHPILTPFVEQTAEHGGSSVVVTGSLRREEAEEATLLTALGLVFTAGVNVDWKALYPAGNVASVPAYPWQRERFWMEGSATRRRPAGHPLLGEPVETATGERVWSGTLGIESQPWLRDHAVDGTVLLPASAYVEMSLSLGKVLFGAEAGVEGLSLKQALAFTQGKTVEFQAIAGTGSKDVVALRFFWRDAGEGMWQQAASCHIRRTSPRSPLAANSTPWEEVEFDPHTIDSAEHTRRMAETGYQFGPAFCAVEWINADHRGALGQIRSMEPRSGYLLHPATLDAALQILAHSLIVRRSDRGVLLPVALERVRWYSGPAAASGPLLVRATVERDALSGNVEIFDCAGRVLMTVHGLTFRPLEGNPQVERALYSLAWEPSPAGQPRASMGESWIVIGDNNGVAAALATELRGRGAMVSLRSLNEMKLRKGPSTSGKVVLPWPLGSDSSLEEAQQALAESAVVLAQLAEREANCIWLLTRGTQPAGGQSVADVLGAGAWGLFASVANEYPTTRMACVDLPAERFEKESTSLADLLLEESNETRIAIRPQGRYVARLVPFASSEGDRAGAGTLRDDLDYELIQRVPGSLDNLELRTAPNEPPGEGEVEIAVQAAGLNFLDVLRALGASEAVASPHFGGECAGIITKVGAGVRTFRPGDAVLAITPKFRERGMVRSRVRIPEALVARKPGGMSFAQAAGIPCVFLTAWYGLIKMAQLGKGERILIHAGAGGVGLAAIQIANLAGAEVWATAGSEEKREFLRELGIKHVMNSRTLDFSREILERTGGRGVDVVLNSLAGRAMTAGLEALAPYGRFVEIGKRDIWENNQLGLEPFRKNLSFFAVDLSATVEDRPALVGAMLGEIMQRFETGDFSALPTATYPISAASEAFRYMARAAHRGKVVLQIPEPSAPVRRDNSALRPDATYLVTGGLGGIGLKTAEVLVRHGARHLLLLSRGAPSDPAKRAIAAMEGCGAEIRIAHADVSDHAAMAALLEGVRAGGWPLRGIVHAAGVLDDATATNLTAPKFASVMAGKVGGAQILDSLIVPADLDFLIYTSSIAGILGTPGQANYAAANSMLDALAHRQRDAGIASVSVDWGTWGEVGLAAAAENRGARMELQGLTPFKPPEGQALLERILEDMPVQVAAMKFDAERWCVAYPRAANTGLLSRLRATNRPAPGTDDILSELASIPKEALETSLMAWLRKQVAGVLRLDVEGVPVDIALRSLGLDSLMALELRNRLERQLRVKLSPTIFWNHPTLSKLAGFLRGRLESGVPSELEGRESGRPVQLGKAAERKTGLDDVSAAAMLESELLEAESFLRQ
jgi:acyl transferase domain-containing protein/NADPH:quinone reductase-like Zn-dependent oxidoreductase/NAD(P)-dependent dehydrogenase (short-subunit alcohol dehydrogenase family)/acyl carrier protein